MGEGIIQPSPSITIKDYFDELFTYALSVGMSPRQFWDEDVTLLKYYVEAETLRQERKNTECWLAGYYVMHAVASNLSKNAKYPRRPIALTQEEIDRRNNDSLLKLREELIAEAKKGR